MQICQGANCNYDSIINQFDGWRLSGKGVCFGIFSEDISTIDNKNVSTLKLTIRMYH